MSSQNQLEDWPMHDNHLNLLCIIPRASSSLHARLLRGRSVFTSYPISKVRSFSSTQKLRFSLPASFHSQILTCPIRIIGEMHRSHLHVRLPNRRRQHRSSFLDNRGRPPLSSHKNKKFSFTVCLLRSSSSPTSYPSIIARAV